MNPIPNLDIAKKRSLTDAELVARIILTFYGFPKKNYLTAIEITDHLAGKYEFEIEKVDMLLNMLFKIRLITCSKFTPNESHTEEVRWHWSILMDEKSGRPRHLTRL